MSVAGYPRIIKGKLEVDKRVCNCKEPSGIQECNHEGIEVLSNEDDFKESVANNPLKEKSIEILYDAQCNVNFFLHQDDRYYTKYIVKECRVV